MARAPSLGRSTKNSDLMILNPESEKNFMDASDKYLPDFLEKVKQRAVVIANGGDESTSDGLVVTFKDAYSAFEEILGVKVSGRWEAFFRDNLFLWISIFLTLMFGGFALYYKSGNGGTGFLDIAKIFAGVIVGGAASKKSR